MREQIFRQYDNRWGKLAYPTKAYSFAGNGCGCCAVTHVIIELEKYKKYTPKDVRPYMVKQGFATEGQGTLHKGITLALRYYGLKPCMHETMPQAFDELSRIKKGCRAGIILFDKGTKGGVTWTSGGHYVAFLDYKVVDGKHYFYMKDSGARHNDGWYCYETHMKGLIKEIWTVELPTVRVGKYYTVGKTYTVVSGRNVRTGAGMSHKKVGYLQKGMKIKCLQTSTNGRWIRHGLLKWSCGRSASGDVYIK